MIIGLSFFFKLSVIVQCVHELYVCIYICMCVYAYELYVCIYLCMFYIYILSH